MKRRQAILMLGGVSSGSLLIGSGAFSSARAERNVGVSVAEDGQALVGYDSEDRIVPADLDGDQLTLVTVTNELAQTVSVDDDDVQIGDRDAYFSGVDVPDEELAPGESVDITGSINLESGEQTLDPGDSIDVSVSITVSGTSVEAELFGDNETRRFSIKNEVDSLTFTGSRRATVTGATGQYTIDLWFASKDGSDFEEGITQTRDWNEGNISPDGSANSEIEHRCLLAVRFQETEQTFYRPHCDISRGDIPWDVERFIPADKNGNPCN